IESHMVSALGYKGTRGQKISCLFSHLVSGGISTKECNCRVRNWKGQPREVRHCLEASCAVRLFMLTCSLLRVLVQWLVTPARGGALLFLRNWLWLRWCKPRVLRLSFQALSFGCESFSCFLL
ncbi:mCG7981, isoform CRA_b, partial [Mus musculus]